MSPQPLAEELRPKSLPEIVGQGHLTAEDGFITRVIKSGHPLSILLWGPPGCGKTSLARLYARAFDMDFRALSAVFSGVADLRKIIQDITGKPLFNKGCVIFVDEIHRFNKAQQDAFLPYVEDGTVTLVGATTENPSFHLNDALLSRLRVLTLEALNEGALDTLLTRFENKEGPLPLSDEARTFLLHSAQGDGRYLLNLIENIRQQAPEGPVGIDELEPLIQRRAALFDRAGDQHYNLISTLHKAVRGSDVDATVYWLARMLDAGEDPLFIARRLIRMASEDIGLADPQALSLAVAARDSYQMLGSPEGELALAQAAIYLALAPKSNACYHAFKQAQSLAQKSGQLSPPKHSLNAPTRLMKEEGYGAGYVYDHDVAGGCAGQDYFPDSLTRQEIYTPVERGFEREMSKRCAYFRKLRAENSSPHAPQGST
jgi:putative ATPase